MKKSTQASMKIKLKKRKHILILLVSLIFLIGGTALTFRSSHQYAAASGNTVTIDLNTPDVTSQFLPGGSLIHTDTKFSNATEQQQLGAALGYLNVFLMGWGTDNPEPSPGKYNWSSLDARIQAIRATKTTGIISLCCAPDWMKGGSPGQTNWNNIEVAPLPAHYKDFAALSAEVAKRYPDIKYFQVWNELKGFNKNGPQYILMYNQVYDAIKKIRPDAKIGGPYVSLGDPSDTPQLKTIVTSWLNQKHGAEFVVFDGGFASTNQTQDFTGAQFFTDIVKWLRTQPNGGATLPIVWAEWYPGTMKNWNDLNHYNATMTNAMIYTLRGGATYALTWGVEGGVSGAYQPGDGQQENLIVNGKPTPFGVSVKYLKDYFGPGTKIYKVIQTTPDVTVLASKSKTLLVNHLGSPQTITVNGKSVNLTAYQVLLIDTPGQPSALPPPIINPTLAKTPNPTLITPTLYCLGGCQTPSQSPNQSGGNQNGNGRGNNGNGNGSDIENGNNNENRNASDSGSRRGWKAHNKSGSGVLASFIALIIAFLQMLLQFLH